MNLETLVLELVADDSKLSRDIDAAVRKAIKKLAAVEKGSPIKPKVELDNLHELNELLDVKQNHLFETVGLFENNPIAVKVDTLSLDRARAEVAALQGELNGMSAIVKAEVTHKFEGQQESNRAIVNELRRNNLEAQKTNKELSKKDKNLLQSVGSGLANIATSPIKNVVRGFQEGIGITAAEKFFSGSIRSIEKQWNFTLDKIGEVSGNAFGSVGKVGAEAILRIFGTTSIEINQLFGDIQDNFNSIFDEKEAIDKINKIADALNRVVTKIATAGVMPDSELNDLSQTIKDYQSMGRKNREDIRAKAMRRTVAKAQSTGADVKPLDVSGKSKAVFYVPGFAGNSGQSDSSDSVAQLQAIYGESAKVIPVTNASIDTTVSSAENPVRWTTEIVNRLTKMTGSGEPNDDVVKLLQQIVQLRAENPDIQIEIVGRSAGGFIAEQVVAGTKMMGIDGVKAVGLGTPSGIMPNSGSGDNYSAFMGSGDPIAKLVKAAGLIGLDGNQGVNLDVSSHSLIDYLADPKVQRRLMGDGFEPVDKSELIRSAATAKVKTINAQSKEFQDRFDVLSDDEKTQIASAMSNSIKDARQFIFNAMGEADDETQKLLKEIDKFYYDLQRQFAQHSNASNSNPQTGNRAKIVGQLGAMAVGAGINQVATVAQSAIPVIQGAIPVMGNVAQGVGVGLGELSISALNARNQSILVNQSVPKAMEYAQSYSVDSQGKPIVFSVGGVLGRGGIGGKVNRKIVSGFYGNQAKYVSHDTPNTDFKLKNAEDIELPKLMALLPQSMQDMALMGMQAFHGVVAPSYGMIGRLPVKYATQGYNEDAVTLAGKMMAAQQQNPGVDVCALGHCGGGMVVQEAMAILEKANSQGMKGVAAGTANFPVVPSPSDGSFNRILGDEDFVGQSIGSALPWVQQGNTSDFGKIANISSHNLQDYLKHPNLLKSLPSDVRKIGINATLKSQEAVIADYIKRIENGEANLQKYLSERINETKRFIDEVSADFDGSDFTNWLTKVESELGTMPIAGANINDILLEPLSAPVQSIDAFIEKQNSINLPQKVSQINIPGVIGMPKYVSSTDIWDDNYAYPDFVNQTPIKPKVKRKVNQPNYVDPFTIANQSSKTTKTVSGENQLASLVTINSNIYKEVAAIHALMVKSNPSKSNKLSNKSDVIHGEFVDLPENNKLQKMLKDGGHHVGNAIQQLYGVASGLEQFVFDAVEVASLGFVNLGAAKKVTQTVAPGVMLGMAAHNNPMLGAGMDMLSSNVVTPLLTGGGGALLHGVAGLLPEGIANGASTIANIAGRIPGSGVIAQNAGMMGASAMGGLGTLLTYLGVGRGVAKGGQFALGQAVKPLGLLPGNGQGAQNATYNALTGTATVIGGMVGSVNQMRGLPPRPVEYVTAEIVPSEPIALPGKARLALPPSNSIDSIDSQLKNITQVVQDAIEDDNKELIESAYNRAKEIVSKLKGSSDKVNEVIKTGNLNFAKVYAREIKIVSNLASNELKRITELLQSAGLNTNVGASGIKGQFNQLKSTVAGYGNRMEETALPKINRLEKNASYIDIPTLQQTLGAKAQELGFDETAASANNLMKALSNLEGLDLNQFFTVNGRLNKAGKEIMTGLIQGLQGEDGKLDSTITELAQSLPNQVKKILGIKSPSKVFEVEVGIPIGQGVEVGAVSSIQKANKTIQAEVAKIESVITKDIEYLKAVATGDTAKAQLMVNNAATKAGYNVAYRGSSDNNAELSEMGNGTVFLATDPNIAKEYGNVQQHALKKDLKLLDLSPKNEEARRFIFGTYNMKELKEMGVKDPKDLKKEDIFNEFLTDSYSDNAIGMFPGKNAALNVKMFGYDGVKTADKEFWLADAISKYKANTSLDAVAYNKKGNIIPLSSRFNENTTDTQDIFAGLKSNADKSLHPTIAKLQSQFNAMGSDSIESLIDFLEGLLSELQVASESIGDTLKDSATRSIRDANKAISKEIEKINSVIADDIEYLQAVKVGDTAKAQSMLDSAAQKAGYKVGPVYHGTNANFTKFKNGKDGFPIFFTDSEQYAKGYMGGKKNVVNAYLKTSKVFDANAFTSEQESSFKKAMESDNRNPEYMLNAVKQNNWAALEVPSVLEWMRDNKYDSFNTTEGNNKNTAVFNPKQIKLANAVTESKGVVVPLSARFADVTDIRGNVNNIFAGLKANAGKNLKPLIAEFETQFAAMGDNSVQSLIASLEGLLGKLRGTGEEVGQTLKEFDTAIASITDELLSASHGQIDARIVTRNKNDQVLGTLDYSEYQGNPSIKHIAVAEEARRKGIATNMVKKLQSNYPGKDIDWGMMTDEGNKLKASIYKKAPVSIQDFEEYLLSKYKALEKLVLSEHRNAIKIDGIQVNKNNRPQGVSTQVIDEIKQFAAAKNLPIVLESSPEKGKKAKLEQFYKDQGFKKPGRNRNFELPSHSHVLNQTDNEYKDIGENAIDSLHASVRDHLSGVENSGELIGESLAKGTEKSLEIASPSKRFARYGRFIVDGLVSGINTTANKAYSTVRKVADGIQNAWDDVSLPLEIDDLFKKARSISGDIKQQSFNQSLTGFTNSVRGKGYKLVDKGANSINQVGNVNDNIFKVIDINAAKFSNKINDLPSQINQVANTVKQSITDSLNQLSQFNNDLLSGIDAGAKSFSDKASALPSQLKQVPTVVKKLNNKVWSVIDKGAQFLQTELFNFGENIKIRQVNKKLSEAGVTNLLPLPDSNLMNIATQGTEKIKQGMSSLSSVNDSVWNGIDNLAATFSGNVTKTVSAIQSNVGGFISRLINNAKETVDDVITGAKVTFGFTEKLTEDDVFKPNRPMRTRNNNGNATPEAMQEIIDMFDGNQPISNNNQNVKSGAGSTLQDIYQKAKTVLPILDDLENRFSSFFITVKKFGMLAVGGLGLALLAKGLFEVGKGALNAYRNMEGVFMAAKLLKGSDQYIADLRQQAIALGSDLQSTLEQGIQFSSALVGTPLETMAGEMFKDSSKALTLMGLQQQEYNSALLALKQVASKGRVSLEEITGQLGEAVPGTLPLIAEALGTNVAGAIQQIESGNVLAEELLPKLIAGMENRTAGLAPVYERSLTAATGRVGTSLQDINIQLGQQLAPVVIPAINAVSDVLINLGQNIDGVVSGVKYLALALAGQMIPALGSLVKFIYSSVQGFIAYNGITLQSVISTKTLATAMNLLNVAAKPLLLAFAAISAFEIITFAFKEKGSQQVMDTIQDLDKALILMKGQEDNPVNIDISITGSGFLDLIDNIRAKLDSLPSLSDLLGENPPDWVKFLMQGPLSLTTTFKDQAFNGQSERVNELLNKSNTFIQSNAQLSDAKAVGDYVAQLNDIDQQIAQLQGRMAALRMVDAQKNADEISSIQKQISGYFDDKGNMVGGLIQQRQGIESSFMPGGLDMRKRLVDSLKKTRDEQLLQREFYIKEGDTEKVKRLDDQIKELTKSIDVSESQISMMESALKSLGNTLNAQRESFINLSGAIAQTQQNVTNAVNSYYVALGQQQLDIGLQDQVDQFNSLQLAVYEAEQQIQSLQYTLNQQKSFINSDVIDTKSRQNLEDLIGGKSLNDVTIQDVTKIKEFIAGNNQIKQAVGDQLVGTLEEIATGNTRILEAQRGLIDNKKALAQFSRTQEDYFRDTARQVYDLNRQIEQQAIQDQRSIEDFGLQVAETSRQLRLSNRNLIESYQDLGADFNIQIETVQKSLEDAKNNIELSKLRTQNLSITPGNSNSAARQLNAMVLRFTESLFSNRTNERQIKIDVLNLEKERISRLRQVRQIEEQYIENVREYDSQVRQLNRSYVDLQRGLTDSTNNLRRAFEDLYRTITRNDKSSPESKTLTNALGSKFNYSPNTAIPQANNYGAKPSITYNQATNQTTINNNNPSLWTDEMALPTQSSKGEVYVGDNGQVVYEPEYDTAKPVRSWEQVTQQSRQFNPSDYAPGDTRIFNGAMNANQNGGYILDQYTNAYGGLVNNASNPYQSQRVQQPKPQPKPTEVKPVSYQQSKVYNTSQSLVLPGGYEQLQKLINKVDDLPVFNPNTDTGAAALAINTAIAATELLGRGSKVPESQFATRKGGSGGIYEGYGQYHPGYHPGARHSLTAMGNYTGQIITGQRLLPNSKGKNNFAAMLVNAVRSGQINDGQDFIQFLNRGGKASLAGTASGYNWQGLADGWGRNPGLADVIADWLNRQIGNVQSKLDQSGQELALNFDIPESIELGQYAQLGGLFEGAGNVFKSERHKLAEQFFLEKYGQEIVDIEKQEKTYNESIKALIDNDSNYWQEYLLKEFNDYVEKKQSSKTSSTPTKPPVTPPAISNPNHPDFTNRVNNQNQPPPRNQGVPKLESDMQQWNAPNTATPAPAATPKPQAIDYQPLTAKPFNLSTVKQQSFMGIINRELNPSQVQLQGFDAGQVLPKQTKINTDPVMQQANRLTALNQQLIQMREAGIKQDNIEKFAQLIDDVTGFSIQLQRTVIETDRTINDQSLSILQMSRNAKGFLTIMESARQSGIDTFQNYTQQIRSIDDKQREIALFVAEKETIKATKQVAILQAQSQGLNTDLLQSEYDTIGALIDQYDTQSDILETQEQQLLATRDIAAANAFNNAYLEKQLNYLDKAASLMASISGARYDLGGTLVNDGAIIQAKMALDTVQQRALVEAKTLGLTGQARADFIAQSKELAEINYQKSFREAIPFIQELGANLKEAIFQTNNFTQAFTKLLDVMASQIFDQLVLKPVTNTLSQWTADMFGYSSPNMPTPENGGGFDAGSVFKTAAQLGTATLTTDQQNPIVPFTESLNNATDIIPTMTEQMGVGLMTATGTLTSFTNTSISMEQSALLQFVNALQIATQSLYQFAMQAGGGGLFGTIADGLIGMFTGGFGAANAASAFIPTSGYTGDTVQLPAFAMGTDEVDILNFAEGIDNVDILNFANGIDAVMAKEKAQTGQQPMLAVVNQGEAILSTLNGDAQKFRALKRTGVWDDIPNLANGTDRLYNDSRNYRGNWGMEAMLPSLQTRQAISNQRNQVVNNFTQSYTVVTPNADSFRRSQSQIQDEGARVYRRKMR
jgi:tape measure domain-containing protein